MKYANIEDCIFYTTDCSMTGQNWQVLEYLGEPFTYIEDAVSFIRNNPTRSYVGLADFKQMKMDNAQWDNL